MVQHKLSSFYLWEQGCLQRYTIRRYPATLGHDVWTFKWYGTITDRKWLVASIIMCTNDSLENIHHRQHSSHQRLLHLFPPKGLLEVVEMNLLDPLSKTKPAKSFTEVITDCSFKLTRAIFKRKRLQQASPEWLKTGLCYLASTSGYWLIPALIFLEKLSTPYE